MWRLIMTEYEKGASPSCRYFYTDPLAAAWMAKYFGIKIMLNDPDRGPELKAEEIAAYITAEAEGDTSDRDTRYYIHTDSLHLLEPRIGDLYYNSCNGSYHEVTEKGSNPPGGRVVVENWECKEDDIDLSTATMWWNYGKTHDRIIQRKDKPFFWPERQAV
jgi:hypothetical protein